MSEIVFVLGAGASAHTGAPVMATFLENSRRLSRRVLEPWKKDFGLVFEAINELQRVHSKARFDIHNLETVFTILEIAKTVRKLPGFEDPDKIAEVVESFKRVIAYTLALTTLFEVKRPSGDPIQIRPSEAYSKFAQLVKKLGDINSKFSVSIITFNYDIALDHALEAHGLSPDYCLPRQNLNSEKVKLLKLHGSLNWGKIKGEEKKDIYYYDRLVHFAQDQAHRVIGPAEKINVPIADELPHLILNRWPMELEGKKTADIETVIVPPGFYKAEHHETIGDVWASAAKELAEAEDILIIGFSLPTTDYFLIICMR